MKLQRDWKVYLVHNSHHDFGYTDLPSNVLEEYECFMDQVLRFCERTEDFPEEAKFKYVIEGSWSILNFMERNPKRGRKLIEYIKKEQVEVTAFFGNVITELCGTEELIRILYPSFLLKQRYGVEISSAELNDIPGLAWGLADILASSGVKYLSFGVPDYYCFEYNMKRPNARDVHYIWDEEKVIRRDLPGAFRWKGIDGGEVLVWKVPERGGCGGFYMWNLEEAEKEILSELKRLEENGYPFDIVRFQLKSGIRDNSPPSLRFSEIVKEWNKKWGYPKLILSTNKQFFEELERRYCDRFPVIKGELPDTDYTIGALSMAKETGINRKNHDDVLSAEKFATMGKYLAGYIYPKEKIRKAYRDIFFYDLHCFGLANPVGEGQDASKFEKSTFAYRASAIIQDILSKSLNKIADDINLEEGYYIVVFNPLSWKRTDVVRAPFMPIPPCGSSMYWENSKFKSGRLIGRDVIGLPPEIGETPFELVDMDTGEEIPYQIVELKNWGLPIPYSPERYALGQLCPSYLKEIVFIAKDVPPLGYKTYKIKPGGEKIRFKNRIKVTDSFIENDFFKVFLEPSSGLIRSIYDKELGRELVDSNAPHKFGQIVSRFAKDGKEGKFSKWEIEKGKEGPVYGSVLISGCVKGCPQVVTEIVLYDEIKRIDVLNRVLRDSLPLLEVYFAFPFSIENPEFTFEGVGCVIEPLKDQFPSSNTDYYAVQHWVDIFNEGFGVTFSSIEAPILEFGGLSPGYISQAHHLLTFKGYGHEFKKTKFEKGYLYSYIMNNNFRTNFYNVQVSDSLFRYSFTSHRGNWREAKAYRFGWEFLNPLIPVNIRGKRMGKLPQSMSFCEMNRANVVILNLKEAEDGKGLILRVMETEGKNGVVRIKLPWIKPNRAWITNLVEENKREIPVKDGIEIDIEAFEIKSIRIEGEGKLKW